MSAVGCASAMDASNSYACERQRCAARDKKRKCRDQEKSLVVGKDSQQKETPNKQTTIQGQMQPARAPPKARLWSQTNLLTHNIHEQQARLMRAKIPDRQTRRREEKNKSSRKETRRRSNEEDRQ